MNRTDSLIRKSFAVYTRKTCDTKIHDLDGAVGKQHYILRFDITVNDSLIMCMLKRSEDLGNKMQSIFPLQNALLFNKLFKSYAVDIFHNYILYLVGKSHIIDLYDVRVRKNSNSLAFISESSEELLVFSKFRFKYLDSYLTVLHDVNGFIYISHSANTDKLC